MPAMARTIVFRAMILDQRADYEPFGSKRNAERNVKGRNRERSRVIESVGLASGRGEPHCRGAAV
jgi:hypothetical protein